MKWYQLSVKDVLHKTDSQVAGLTKEERKTRLKNNGRIRWKKRSRFHCGVKSPSILQIY